METLRPARVPSAQALAARLLPRLDAASETLGRLRPWERRRALVEMLGRELEATLQAPPLPWSELREGEVLEAVRGLVGPTAPE